MKLCTSKNQQRVEGIITFEEILKHFHICIARVSQSCNFTTFIFNGTAPNIKWLIHNQRGSLEKAKSIQIFPGWGEKLTKTT